MRLALWWIEQRNIPPAPTYCSLLGKFQTHIVKSLLLSNGCLNAGLPVVSKSVELVKAVLDVLSACLHSVNIVVIQISAGLWATTSDTHTPHQPTSCDASPYSPKLLDYGVKLGQTAPVGIEVCFKCIMPLQQGLKRKGCWLHPNALSLLLQLCTQSDRQKTLNSR